MVSMWELHSGEIIICCESSRADGSPLSWGINGQTKVKTIVTTRGLTELLVSSRHSIKLPLNWNNKKWSINLYISLEYCLFKLKNRTWSVPHTIQIYKWKYKSTKQTNLRNIYCTDIYVELFWSFFIKQWYKSFIRKHFSNCLKIGQIQSMKSGTIPVSSWKF